MGDRAELAGRKLHFIAIGGAGMSGLAVVAAGLGAEVSGSDRAASSYMETLRRVGIEPMIGHDANQVPTDADVVISTAIPADNVELVRARERGQRVMHRGEMLAELCSMRRLIAVSGTHGKTTTSAMIVHALHGAGADPAFVLGGELPGAGPDGARVSAGWGDDGWIVAEADESDGSFLKLNPEVAVVTNVELDHRDRWASRSELIGAFEEFCDGANAVVLSADPGLASVGAGAASRQTYDADLDGGRVADEDRIKLAVPGDHNQLNARAALAALDAARRLDGGSVIPAHDELVAALADFPGAARRQEFKGTHDGAVIYDDYAHHPTEVAVTLQALRELPHERLIAVFQPHLYSRTKAFAQRFGAALAAADEVVVLDVYAAREQPTGPFEGVSGLIVANAAADASGGRPVWWLPTMEQAERVLAPRLGEGDLLVTIGAGNVFELGEALVDGVEADG